MAHSIAEPQLLINAEAAINQGKYADALSGAHRLLEDPHLQASPGWLARAYYVIGSAAHELGEDLEARAQFRWANRYAIDAGDDMLQLRCQLSLAQCDHRAGDLAAALDSAAQVLASAREYEWPLLEAGALATIANIAWKRGDFDAAAGDLERAYQIYDRLGEQRLSMRVKMTLGYVWANQGSLERGWAMMQKCLDYFQETGDFQAAAKTLCNLAFTHYSRGALAEARDLLLRSTELDERHRNRHLSLAAWYNLGLIELAQEWHIAAQHSFTRAQALAQLLGDRTTGSMSLLYLGALALFGGHPREALHDFEQACASFEGMEMQERLLEAYFLAAGLAALDKEEEARAQWDQRAKPAELQSCQDDLQLAARLLEFILSPEYLAAHPLSAQAQFSAGRWLDTLQRELAQLGPPAPDVG